MITQENLKNIFHGDIIGSDIIFYESTTSTNDRAIEIGRNRDSPEGIVVIADSQTQGRGRLGRKWISPSGVNLYFSVILQPPFSQQESTILSLAAAASAVSAIKDYTGLNANIKWPNDILINGKKTGGILIEYKSGPGKTDMLVIGMGLNVNMTLDNLPDEIKPFSTSLMIEKGSDVHRIELFSKLLANLESSYKLLIKGDRQMLINTWADSVSTIGKEIQVKVKDQIITGTAEAITGSGGLMIRLPDGREEIVNAGEVTIVKD
jgi:BirA family biotin operon repressor/biotin-[acetyl-CoA-carboxylase] ligase